MWRVCAATLTPIFKTPVTEWRPFYFSHIVLSPNDPHFQNALSLNDPILRNKMLSLSDPFFFIEIIALTEWPTFSPINDLLLICTQYLFGTRNFVVAKFCTKIKSLTKWPPFFLKTEGFTKRSFFFYSPHQMIPHFYFVLTERPPFLFSMSPKDP